MITLVAWTVFAAVAFVLTSWFASTTFVLNEGFELHSRFHISFAATVIILRITQGVTSWAISNAVYASFEMAMWAMATPIQGCQLLTLLTISPTTGPFGVLKLLFSGSTRKEARAWGFTRFLLLAILGVGSIVLFINTSATTSYHPINTFNVLAGAGPFNGSLIAPFLKNFSDTIPYFAIASSFSFVNNPLFSISVQPSSCTDHMTPCDSYLFPGGIYLMWPQLNSSVSADSVVSIENASAIRIDFAEGLSSDDNFFSANSCTIYGEDRVVIEFCLSDSDVHNGSLKADLGVYVCQNGTQDGQCLAKSESESAPNVTTTFLISSYTASSINSVVNKTILSVFDLAAQGEMPPIDVQSLTQAVGWLLNYTEANLTVESSPDFQFWDTGPDAYQAIWEENSFVMLKSIVAFIFWEFNANNNGNPAVSSTELSGQTPDLPAEFNKTASICLPFERFVIDEKYFIVYIVLHSVALIFCSVAVLWALMIHTQLPAITSFPAVDFGAKLYRIPNFNQRLFGLLGRMDGDREVRHTLGYPLADFRVRNRPV